MNILQDSQYILEPLPPKADLETKTILKQLVRSHKALAELKGYAELIPNKNILINAITINEAKDSSEIENIVTTHDELYKAIALGNKEINHVAKEVANYRKAIWKGYNLISKINILTTNMIVEIQQEIENNSAGIRKLPGTNLVNNRTGEIIYTPPTGEKQILELMQNIEKYINTDDDGTDPLVKLAVIHYQFESIHPFYDGNGRTGRIINVVYLILKGLLDSPILYLSGYIIRNKQGYYKLLQSVRVDNDWESWIMYILLAVEETAEETLALVKKIKGLLDETINKVNSQLPAIYSKELVEILFDEIYTRTGTIEDKLGVTRKTAAKYLKELEDIAVLRSYRSGRDVIYLNSSLLELLKGNE